MEINKLMIEIFLYTLVHYFLISLIVFPKILNIKDSNKSYSIGIMFIIISFTQHQYFAVFNFCLGLGYLGMGLCLKYYGQED